MVGGRAFGGALLERGAEGVNDLRGAPVSEVGGEFGFEFGGAGGVADDLDGSGEIGAEGVGEFGGVFRDDGGDGIGGDAGS